MTNLPRLIDQGCDKPKRNHRRGDDGDCPAEPHMKPDITRLNQENLHRNEDQPDNINGAME
jgi:hypothetical protein